MQNSQTEINEPEQPKRPDQPRKAVYTIIDGENNHRGRWIRAGIAFTNRDNSINVYLDTLPMNGKLHIRDFPEEKK